MRALILIVLLTTALSAAAQNNDYKFPKFGKVSEQEFQHTDLEDIGYDAVLLINSKSMYFEQYNGQLRLFNLHHIRIKALKDGFYDEDLFTIHYSGKNEYERVVSPRCWVFRRNGSKNTTFKTKFKHIKYIDRDSLDSRVVINPPQIQAGDIIDIEYTLLTFDFILPPIWKTNCKYPCAASRLVTKFPHFMKYKFDCKGAYSDEIIHGSGDEFISMSYSYSPQDNPQSLYYTTGPVRRAMIVYKFRGETDTFKVFHTLPVEMYENQHVSKLYGTSAVRMRAAKFTQDIGYNGILYTAWQQLTHLLYTYANPDNRYLTQNEAWHQIYTPGYVLVSSDNWQRLHKRTKKSPDFWKPVSKAVTMPEQLRDISDPDTPLDTIEATKRIYNYVRDAMTWDSTGGNHILRSIDNILKSRRGNTAEINLALVSLLRHQGVDAFAVFAATTDFGEVDSTYANTAQFNAVLACVPYEQHLILMDATAKNMPFGKIPAGRYDPLMWAFTPTTGYFIEAETDYTNSCDAKKIPDR